MSLPEIVTREQWRVARDELLVKEKSFTRQRDALNAERRRLPTVEVTEEYVFEGSAGKATLPDLFEGRRQTALGRQEDWEEPKGRAVDARAAVPNFST